MFKLQNEFQDITRRTNHAVALQVYFYLYDVPTLVHSTLRTQSNKKEGIKSQ